MDPDSSPLPPPPSRRSAARSQGVPGVLQASVTDGRGRAVPDGGLARWLASVAPARARGELGIALVSDGHIRRLNQTYRGKNAPTDVLSFATEPEPVTAGRAPRVLGDIVIARGVAGRQAADMRHSLRTELRVLALHGLLHLLGYDHDSPDDKGRMARVEARLRRKGGLRQGLIARARR